MRYSRKPRDDAAQRLTVRAAFAAVRRGDFEADVVREVLRGRAGTPGARAELNELLSLVQRVMRHSGAT